MARKKPRKKMRRMDPRRRGRRVGKVDGGAGVGSEESSEVVLVVAGAVEVEEWWEWRGMMANLLRATGTEQICWSSGADAAGQLSRQLSTSLALDFWLLLARAHLRITGRRMVCGQRKSHIIVVRPAAAMMAG